MTVKLDTESEGNVGTNLVVCLGAGPVVYLETELVVKSVNHFLSGLDAGLIDGIVIDLVTD